jgi:copper oxidase (laccase) domain-containing protein
MNEDAQKPGGDDRLDCRVKPGTYEHMGRNRLNRGLVARTFKINASRILTSRQDTPDVLIVSPRWDVMPRPGHHAIVMKDIYDTAICVLTNDCAPILFVDKDNPIVAAAHIGWREAANNVIERTIAAMEYLGSRKSNIMASIGPCAGVDDTYEVGEKFARLYPNNDPEIEIYMERVSDNKTILRFQDYVAHRLERCGVESGHILRTRVDTINNKDCFSLRRDGPGRGSMISGIKLMQRTWT